MPRQALALRIAVTIAGGSLLALLAPPFNLWWLHAIAYLPMFWVVREDTPRQNRWLGALYGTTVLCVIFRWIVDTIALFSNIPLVPALGILLLFGLAFGGLPYAILWGAVHPLRKRLGDGWILAFPAFEVVLEFIQGYALLFPYNHGVSQFRVPQIWQVVSVTGIWGLSFLAFFMNAAIAEGIYRARERKGPFPWRWVSAAWSTWAVLTIWGAWRFDHVEATLREAPVLRVSQIQSRRSQAERMEMRAKDSMLDWAKWTAEIPPGTADLVVWPEGAAPYPLQSKAVAAMFAELAQHGQFEMIVGSGAREKRAGNNAAFNSTYHVGKDGKVTARYDKMVPLPFGEYLPLSRELPFLKGIISGIGDFEAGTEAIVMQGDKFKFATPICYEAILPGTCRRFDHPDLLVNVTNDAWFGDTAAPYQHAMLAAVRATELGVPLVRSAYTGVSMMVEPDGTIYAETKPFTDVERVVGVRVATFPTLYARFGDWFVALCAAALGAAWWRTRTR